VATVVGEFVSALGTGGFVGLSFGTLTGATNTGAIVAGGEVTTTVGCLITGDRVTEPAMTGTFDAADGNFVEGTLSGTGALVNFVDTGANVN
jgi:hypothetical protein